MSRATDWGEHAAGRWPTCRRRAQRHAEAGHPQRFYLSWQRAFCSSRSCCSHSIKEHKQRICVAEPRWMQVAKPRDRRHAQPQGRAVAGLRLRRPLHTCLSRYGKKSSAGKGSFAAFFSKTPCAALLPGRSSRTSLAPVTYTLSLSTGGVGPVLYAVSDQNLTRDDRELRELIITCAPVSHTGTRGVVASEAQLSGHRDRVASVRTALAPSLPDQRAP